MPGHICSHRDATLDWTEAAMLLGVSVRTLQRIKARGEIGYVVLSRGAVRPHIGFTREQVDEYLRARRVEARSRVRA